MKEKAHALAYFEFTEQKNIERHFHRDIEIFYILEGEAVVEIDHEHSHLKASDFILVNTNRVHKIEGSGNFLAGYIHLNYTEVCQYFESGSAFFICDSTHEDSKRYEDLRRFILKIFGQYFKKNAIQQLSTEILYLQLIHELALHFQIYPEHPKYKRLYGTEHEQRKSFIEEYIENHYFEKLALADVAQKLYLTDTYFSKYMKQAFGMTFIEYVNEVRLHHAVEDMFHSQASMTRIAMDNGFANTSIFNRIFDAHYHMSPTEYRKKKILSKSNASEAAYDALPAKDRIEQKVKQYLFGDSFEGEINNANNCQIYADCSHAKVYCPSELIVNVGTVDCLLNSEIQNQIVTLQKNLQFKYIRFWGLYQKNLHMISDVKTHQYNFNKIDKGLDFLIQHKLHPFLELGMKPLQIIKTLDNYILYEEPEITFENAQLYGIFIHDFIVHCVNRYGEKEVSEWCFEVWCDHHLATITQYWESFSEAYNAIKSCIPKAKIGGGGFNMSRDTEKLRKFLRKWDTTHIQPDFVSISSYHYIPYAQQGEAGVIDKKWKRSIDNNYLFNQLQTAKRVMYEAQKQNVELYVTEWNLTNSSREILNDTCFKGAYLLKEMIDTVGCIRQLGYWTMLDAFSEYYDSTKVLDGSGGVLTKDGIFKPSYYAFLFIQQMGRYLIEKSENCLITTDDYGNYYIVCHNYKSSSFWHYLNMGKDVDITNVELIFDNYEALNMSIVLKNIRNGSYRSHIKFLNSKNGSVYDIWKNMGEPDEIFMEDIDYLKNTSIPKVYIENYTITEEQLALTFKMEPNEIRYIKIQCEKS